MRAERGARTESVTLFVQLALHLLDALCGKHVTYTGVNGKPSHGLAKLAACECLGEIGWYRVSITLPPQR